MKIKLNMDLLGNKAGDIINIEDDNGIPVDSYWRKRVKDSEIDNCVEIVKESKNKVKKENKKIDKGSKMQEVKE